MSELEQALLAVEFASADTLMAAESAARAAGWQVHETFTPWSTNEEPEGSTERPSAISRFALAAGVLGAIAAVAIQWWTNARSYPLVVGGRPRPAFPAYVPIAFETTVLAAAVAVCLGWGLLLGLPRLWAPIDDAAGFERASIDRFWMLLGPPPSITGAAAHAWVIEHDGIVAGMVEP